MTVKLYGQDDVRNLISRLRDDQTVEVWYRYSATSYAEMQAYWIFYKKEGK